MAESVGAIYYTVEADTAKLLTATTDGETSLDNLERQFKRTDKAANESQFQMTKTAAAVKSLGRESTAASSQVAGLAKVMGALLGVQGVRGLIEMAEAYNEMAERVRMASSSTAEYEMVQSRLLNTANKTYRSLAEAQEVYILTADSVRSLGYNTEQALDITDSLSYSFVKNATSVDRANGAISAFTKALNKGKIEADGWESLVAAVPTIVNDIATAAGKISQEIRQMGVSGELTAKMLTEGLRGSLEENRKAADGMATTLKDAFRNLSNNLSVYVGEANNASGATGLLSASIIKLGENIDVIVKALLAAGAGALASYIAKTGGAALANAASALAARSNAIEQTKLAAAEEAAAAAASLQAAANVRLGGSQAAAAAAAARHAAAQTALAAAQSRVTSVGAAMLSFLGGPVGIISLVATAAAGYALFGTNLGTARSEIVKMNGSLDDQIKRFRELGELQRSKAIADFGDAIREQTNKATSAFSDLVSEIEPTTARGAKAVAQARAAMRDELQGIVSDTSLSADDLESKIGELIDKWAAQNGWNEQTVQSLRNVSAEFTTSQASVNDLIRRLSALTAEHDRLTTAQRTGAAAARDFNGALNDAQTDDFLDKLKKRRASIEDGNSATKQAERYIASLNNVSAERIALIRSEAAAVDAAQKKADASRKAVTASTKAANSAAKEQKTAEAENIKVIDQLAASLYEAGLKGEALAVTKAKASLNKFATPEQVAQVQAMAAALAQIDQAQSNKQLLGQVDPIAGAQMDFETQLANLQKLNEAKLLEDQRYLDLKAQAEQAYDERARALQEENFRRQSSWNALLIDSVNHLGATATDTLLDLASGASTGADAVRALGAAILREGVDSLVQMGLQYVKNLIIGKTAAAASTAFGIAQAGILAAAWAPAAALASLASFGANAAPAGAALASTMALSQGLALTGAGRQYGGGVDASKMYRINENGAPEILNAANGQQFLLPNRRGEVVSNKDATRSIGGGGINLTVQLIEDQSRAGQVEQQRVDDRDYIVRVVVADIMGGGDISNVGGQVFGWQRRGR